MPLRKSHIVSNLVVTVQYAAALEPNFTNHFIMFFFQELSDRGDHGEAVHLTVATALKQDIARVSLHLA